MSAFISASCAPMVWVIAILELLLLFMMVRKFKSSSDSIYLYSALITAGLFLDAFFIGLGVFIPAARLGFLSRIRFLAHGILIPVLFLICSEALQLKGMWKKIVLVLTLVLMVAGAAEAFATVLQPVEIAGVSRMASAKDRTPSWAETISTVLSFGTVIPLMIVGIVCWIRQKTPLLFLSGFFMFAFSALGPATGNTQFIFYISMYGEILMMLFIFLYANRREKGKG